MKKILAILILVLGTVQSEAKVHPIDLKRVSDINIEQHLSRQTCTITMAYVVDGELQLVSYTASAGWFLSNNEDAYARACEKALDMLMADMN